MSNRKHRNMDLILADYVEGLAIREITARNQCARATVNRVARAAGEPRRGLNKLTLKTQVLDLVAQGVNPRSIHNILGRNPQSVRNVLALYSPRPPKA